MVTPLSCRQERSWRHGPLHADHGAAPRRMYRQEPAGDYRPRAETPVLRCPTHTAARLRTRRPPDGCSARPTRRRASRRYRHPSRCRHAARAKSAYPKREHLPDSEHAMTVVAAERRAARSSNGPDARARKCRRKFLRIFPGGFQDATYIDWERAYKWQAHLRWREALARPQFESLLEQGE